jgi:hypothetical protein
MKNLFILSFLVCGIAHAQCPVVYEVNATNFTLPSPHEQTTIEINDGYFVGDYNLSYYTQTCGTYRLNDPFAHASWLVYRYSLNGASTHTNYTSIDLDADQLPNLIVEFDVGILAGYAAKQADKHERAQRKHRKMELELASITPYIQEFPEEEARKIKTELAMKMFAQQETAGTKECKKTTESALNLVELSLESIKALIGK